jgi:hypothetical protein
VGRACNTYGKVENTYKILVGKIKGRHLSEDLGVDGSIILECLLWK